METACDSPDLNIDFHSFYNGLNQGVKTAIRKGIYSRIDVYARKTGNLQFYIYIYFTLNVLQWAKIVVVLERGFSKKQLQRFHREYSIKLSGPSPDDESIKEEIRALVVIKTSPKTKARQRKLACANWKVCTDLPGLT